MSKDRWPLALKLYHMFVKFSVWMKEGGWKARAYKTGIMLYPDMERPTSTVVMPLNVDVADKGEKVVVPLELIKESLKNVTYIAGMDAYALGLRKAAEIIEDGTIDSFVADRYASYNDGIGKKITDRSATIEELEAYALAMGDVTTNTSGKQEYLENVMNGILF